MKETYCVVTFHSTYHALQFEKILNENNCEVQLIPVPRQLSSSCGTAGEVSCIDKDKIINLCNTYHIEYGEFHYIEKKAESNWYTKLLKKEKC